MRNIVRILVLLFTVYYKETVAFVPVSLVVPSRISPIQWTKVIDQPSQQRRRYKYHSFSTVTLLASSEDDELELSESSQSILGAAGTLASLIVFYSEFTLKTTGCGLPAGPFGLFGLAEGLSYLGVTGLVAYSLVTKVKTVRVHPVENHQDNHSISDTLHHNAIHY